MKLIQFLSPGKNEVPDNMTLEEAIEYAKKHLDEIPCGELEYISESDELDEENCDFGE